MKAHCLKHLHLNLFAVFLNAVYNHFCSDLTRCHAVNVSDNATYFYTKINEDLRTGGLDVRAEDIVDIIDGYKGLGYGLSTQDELGWYQWGLSFYM